MRALMWFRDDLRIADNTALYHAARMAKDGLIAVYIISPQEWRAHDIAACRVDFILRNLQELKISLEKLHIPLLVRIAKTAKDVSILLLELVRQNKIDIVCFNQQYEIDEARRDLKIEALLQKNNCKVFSYTDQVILAPGEVLTAAGNYYTVFTPFKNAWLKCVTQQKFTLLSTPHTQVKLSIKSDVVPMQIADFVLPISAAQWPAGEKYAQQRLRQFVQEKITLYAKQRDFPAIAGTSTLSAYLAAGVLSPRQCLHAAVEANDKRLQGGKLGINIWITELVWREFYKHVLYGLPRVSMGRAFKIITEKLQWDNDPELFAAWCAGRTGYPIVDAAMRQLKQTCWMHNRLRMIVAMFLVKDLWIDWRWGERYFMQNLIDGDLAANNGGWQWAASTGTDAVPYFRIFNPIAQSKKFDSEGQFIRQFCPELAKLDNELIHMPGLLEAQYDYPMPIVDHAKARMRSLQAFKALKSE